MKDRILLTFALVDLLFLTSGVLLLVFAFTTRGNIVASPKLSTVARDVVLRQIPGTRQLPPLHYLPPSV